MKILLALIILGLSVSFCFSQKKQKPETSVLFSFCPLSISENLMQAQFTSTDAYTFKIDKEGKPFGLKRISWRFVDDEEVKACLSEWKFTGFEENRRFMVSFTWRHMYGWTVMKLISKDFSQTVTQSDDK
jgi:hypothetical protein